MTDFNNKTNILDLIIANKKLEVASSKAKWPASTLVKSEYFRRKTNSLVWELNYFESTGIIAEFKRKSPSKGIINNNADVAFTTSMYELYGAAGVSILTDKKFFGGNRHDIIYARPDVECPILRKDFIIDEYQILEAKAMAADVVLLIAANLSPKEVKSLATVAKNLDLEVLLELHTERELDHICPEVDMIGINNRNLKTFEVDLDHAIRLAEKLPADKPKIAESGINSPETLLYLKQHGFTGFLIGEKFMEETNPEIACRDFIRKLDGLQA